MPIDLVRVLNMSSLDTANPNVTQHCVNAETVEPSPRFVQYFTLNDLRASLCREVAGTSALIWVTWRDGRRSTRDLVHVELDGTPWLHQASR